MKGKRLRIASVVVLLALIAAIPASTQVLFGARDDEGEGTNLPLLVLVNRMELTPEQMEEIHGLLVGLLEERDSLELRRAEFEQEMIAFNGTAEDLDEILEAFRAETEEQGQATREHAAEVIDQIKGILTLKQGEVLLQLIPGLLGGFGVMADGYAEESEFGVRERVIGELEERLGEYPEVLERLQQRLGTDEGSGGGFAIRVQRSGFGMQFGEQAQAMHRGFRGSGRMSQGFQQSRGGAAPQMLFGRGMQHRGLEWIEELVEVLELKLEAIG